MKSVLPHLSIAGESLCELFLQAGIGRGFRRMAPKIIAHGKVIFDKRPAEFLHFAGTMIGSAALFQPCSRIFPSARTVPVSMPVVL